MASASLCYPLASASTSLSSSPLAASSNRVSDAAPTIVSVAPQVGYGSLKSVGLRSNNKATRLWNSSSWVRSEQRGGEASVGVGASGRSVEQSLGHNGDLRSTSTSIVIPCAHIAVLVVGSVLMILVVNQAGFSPPSIGPSFPASLVYLGLMAHFCLVLWQILLLVVVTRGLGWRRMQYFENMRFCYLWGKFVVLCESSGHNGDLRFTTTSYLIACANVTVWLFLVLIILVVNRARSLLPLIAT